MMKSPSMWDRLFEPPKNIGFRIGFVALLLTAITMVFPVFVSIGAPSPTIQSFTNLFYGGMIMTVFFSVALRASSKRKTEQQDMMVLGVMSAQKQVMVFGVGITSGVIMVMVNIALKTTTENILLGSMYGNIELTAFYLGMLAGVAEVYFFCGFLQTLFEIAFGGTFFARLLAVVPSAAIFAWFHAFAYPDNLVALVVLFGIGIVQGLLFALTNDIGAPMVAHCTNNTFAMLPAVITVMLGNVLTLIFFAVMVVFVYLLGAFTSTRRRGGR